jgi:hypothetical protein
VPATRIFITPYVLVAPEVRPRKRLRLDNAQVKDKFNLSNDQFYDVSKDGRHRVRQTFGDLVVEHAYPSQKLQLPFVSHFCEFSSSNAVYHSHVSTRHAWGSRRHDLSIDRLCKYLQISKFGSPKCGQQRKRRTRQDGGLVVGATLGRI